MPCTLPLAVLPAFLARAVATGLPLAHPPTLLSVFVCLVLESASAPIHSPLHPATPAALTVATLPPALCQPGPFVLAHPPTLLSVSLAGNAGKIWESKTPVRRHQRRTLHADAHHAGIHAKSTTAGTSKQTSHLDKPGGWGHAAAIHAEQRGEQRAAEQRYWRNHLWCCRQRRCNQRRCQLSLSCKLFRKKKICAVFSLRWSRIALQHADTC